MSRECSIQRDSSVLQCLMVDVEIFSQAVYLFNATVRGFNYSNGRLDGAKTSTNCFGNFSDSGGLTKNNLFDDYFSSPFSQTLS